MLRLLDKHSRAAPAMGSVQAVNKFWSREPRGYPRAYFQSGEPRDPEHLFVCLVAPMEPCQDPVQSGPGLHDAYWGGVVDDPAIASALTGWVSQANGLSSDALDWCLVPAASAEHAAMALITRSIAPVAILSAAAWRTAEGHLRATLDQAKAVGASGIVARLLNRKPYGILLQSSSGLRTLWYKAASLADAMAHAATEKHADESVAGVVPAQAMADISGAIDNTLAGGWCVQVRIIDGYSQGMEEYKAWLLDVTTGFPLTPPEDKVVAFLGARQIFSDEQLSSFEKQGIARKYEPTAEDRAALVRAVGVVQVLASEGVPPVA